MQLEHRSAPTPPQPADSPDAFVFGPETRGLPATVLSTFIVANRLRIPMTAGSRSINLGNAVAIVLYEAWRQQDFSPGA